MAASGLKRSPEEGPDSSSQSQTDAVVGKQWQILVVEDNKADIFLIRDAIERAAVRAQMHVVNDGQEAIHFFNQTEWNAAACPDLILLDLNLPRQSGEEVLRYIRAKATCKRTRVLIVTSSNLATERETMTALGVDGYFRKPSEYGEYLKLGSIIRDLLTGEQTERTS